VLDIRVFSSKQVRIAPTIQLERPLPAAGGRHAAKARSAGDSSSRRADFLLASFRKKQCPAKTRWGVF